MSCATPKRDGPTLSSAVANVGLIIKKPKLGDTANNNHNDIELHNIVVDENGESDMEIEVPPIVRGSQEYYTINTATYPVGDRWSTSYFYDRWEVDEQGINRGVTYQPAAAHRARVPAEIRVSYLLLGHLNLNEFTGNESAMIDPQWMRGSRLYSRQDNLDIIFMLTQLGDRLLYESMYNYYSRNVEMINNAYELGDYNQVGSTIGRMRLLRFPHIEPGVDIQLQDIHPYELVGLQIVHTMEWHIYLYHSGVIARDAEYFLQGYYNNPICVGSSFTSMMRLYYTGRVITDGWNMDDHELDIEWMAEHQIDMGNVLNLSTAEGRAAAWGIPPEQADNGWLMNLNVSNNNNICSKYNIDVNIHDDNIVDIEYEIDEICYDRYRSKSLTLQARLLLGKRSVIVDILVDTGAQASFIDSKFVNRYSLYNYSVPSTIQVRLADGQQIAVNRMLHEACLLFSTDHKTTYKSRVDLHILGIRSHDVILGSDWLDRHNAEIKWKDRSMTISWCSTYDKKYRVINLTRSNKPSDNDLSRVHEPLDSIILSSIMADVVKPSSSSSSAIQGVHRSNDPITCDRLHNSDPMLSKKQLDKLLKRGEVVDVNIITIRNINNIVNVYNVSSENNDEKPIDPMAKQLMDTYSDVFDTPHGIPPDRDITMKIELKPGSEPPAEAPRRLSAAMSQVLLEDINKLLDQGVIRPSNSEYASPVVLVKKKDGSWRVCVDYRAINRITVRNNYPLPRIDELLDRLYGATYYSKIDLNGAFHQVKMDDDSIAKTAFTTRYGSFEYLVMPFGLTNAPAVFMSLMHRVLHDMIDKFVIVYLDDILIYSKDKKQHATHIDTVLIRLREHKLYAKPSKCEFFKESVAFLGHIVSAKGVAMDPDKVKAITDWPVPTDVNELRSFLGLAGYYRKFVNKFAEITAPLYDLVHEDVVWNWDEQYQGKAFKQLKQCITTDVVLQVPIPNKPFIVRTDASGFAVSGVLSQNDENDNERPIAFFSKKMNKAERNYPVFEQELLAVILSLREWRHYLENEPNTIVYTDHRSLEHIYTQKLDNMSRRQVRWMELIASILPNIKYIKGIDNTVADAISRLPNLMDDDSVEYLDVIELNEISSVGVGYDLLVDIKESYPDDENIKTLLEYTDDELGMDGYERRDGLIYMLNTDRLYIPDNNIIKTNIMRECHDNSLHRGTSKTIQMVKRKYYWPNMHNNITEYVSTCDTCQRVKYSTQRLMGLMNPLPDPEYRFEQISMDLVGRLPVSGKEKYDMIWVIVERYTKFAWFIPVHSTDNATKLANIFYDKILPYNGVPKVIWSDRGTQWNNRFWKELWGILGTKLHMSTAHHQQTNGLTERTIKTLIEMLRCVVNTEHNDWSDKLTECMIHYNNSVHSSTGHTPYKLLTGQEWSGPMTMIDVRDGKPIDWLTELERVLDIARDKMKRARIKQKQWYDLHRRDEQFNVGDRVFLSTTNVHTSNEDSNKLKPLYSGPYKILEKLDNDNYKLELNDELIRRGVYDIFHVSQLRRYRLTSRYEREGDDIHARPPPIPNEQGEWEYEIESILDHETDRNGRIFKYKIKWAGYSGHDNSWITAKDLVTTAPLMVQEYLDKLKHNEQNKTNKRVRFDNTVRTVTYNQPNENDIDDSVDIVTTNNKSNPTTTSQEALDSISKAMEELWNTSSPYSEVDPRNY